MFNMRHIYFNIYGLCFEVGVQFRQPAAVKVKALCPLYFNEITFAPLLMPLSEQPHAR